MDLSGIASALRGMFRLRPNSPVHKEMLKSLNDLRDATAEANKAATSVDEAIEMILGGRDA